MDVSPWAFRILSAGVGPGVDILFFEGSRPHAFSIGLGHGQQLSNTIFFISTIPHRWPMENMMQRTIFIGTHISFLSHSLSFRLVLIIFPHSVAIPTALLAASRVCLADE